MRLASAGKWHLRAIIQSVTFVSDDNPLVILLSPTFSPLCKFLHGANPLIDTVLALYYVTVSSRVSAECEALITPLDSPS